MPKLINLAELELKPPRKTRLSGLPYATPFADLAALHSQHLDHHGPSRICAGPETCSAVGYLAIVEQVIGERDAALAEAAANFAQAQQFAIESLAQMVEEQEIDRRRWRAVRWAWEYRRQRATARDLAVSLESMVHEARADAEAVRAELAETAAISLALKLEVERLGPVIEAAKVWHEHEWKHNHGDDVEGEMGCRDNVQDRLASALDQLVVKDGQE